MRLPSAAGPVLGTAPLLSDRVALLSRDTLLLRRLDYLDGAKQTTAGKVLTILVTFIASSLCAAFFSRHATGIRHWRRFNYIKWLILGIFLDSYLFLFASAVLQYGFDINVSQGACDTSTLLCVSAYVSTKALIYLFLVDRAYIIRATPKPRLKSKLYIFNSFGVMLMYLGCIVLLFWGRISAIVDGYCVSGIERHALVPTVVIDFVINVYLTTLFLVPLFKSHSMNVRNRRGSLAIQSKTTVQPMQSDDNLRRLAWRTLLGTFISLASTMTNLVILTLYSGQVAWLCLLCCKCDILINTIVIAWLSAPNRRNHNRSANRGKRSSKHDNDHNQPHLASPAMSPSTHTRPPSSFRTASTNSEGGLPRTQTNTSSGIYAPKEATSGTSKPHPYEIALEIEPPDHARVKSGSSFTILSVAGNNSRRRRSSVMDPHVT